MISPNHTTPIDSPAHNRKAWSFVITRVPCNFTRKRLFNLLRDLGVITFLQVSRFPSSGYSSAQKSEAYLTFSELFVPEQQILNSRLAVDTHRSPRMKIISKHDFMQVEQLTLFVRKLPKKTSIHKLYHFFSKFGAVRHIRIPGTLSKKTNRGFALVQMQDRLAYKLLVQAGTLNFFGKRILVSTFDPFVIKGRNYKHNLPS